MAAKAFPESSSTRRTTVYVITARIGIDITPKKNCAFRSSADWDGKMTKFLTILKDFTGAKK